jgi:predicted ester cyclase
MKNTPKIPRYAHATARFGCLSVVFVGTGLGCGASESKPHIVYVQVPAECPTVPVGTPGSAGIARETPIATAASTQRTLEDDLVKRTGESARDQWIANLNGALASRKGSEFLALYSHDASIEAFDGMPKNPSEVMFNAQLTQSSVRTRAIWFYGQKAFVLWKTEPVAEEARQEVRFGLRGLSVFELDGTGHATVERRYVDLGTPFASISGQRPNARDATTLAADDARFGASSVREAKLAPPASVERGLTFRSFVYEKGKTEAGLNDDIRYTGLLQTNALRGRTSAAGGIERMSGAFGDVKLTTRDILVADDFLLVEYTFVGRHRVHVGTLKPTGKTVKVHAVGVFRFVDKKISDVWTFQNADELAGQLVPHGP